MSRLRIRYPLYLLALVSFISWLSEIYFVTTGRVDSNEIPTILGTLLTVQGILIGLFSILISFFLEILLRTGQKNFFKEAKIMKILMWRYFAPITLTLIVAVSLYTTLGVSSLANLRYLSYILDNLLFYVTVILVAYAFLTSLNMVWDVSEPKTQVVIAEQDLKDWIDLGWRFVGKLESSKVVVEGTHTETTRKKLSG